MLPDVEVAGSPAWWMNMLSARLNFDRRRFDRLTAWMEGEPPLPWGTEAAEAAFREAIRNGRSNFAELVITALLDRLTIRTIRTAVDADDAGDQLAMAIWDENDMDGQSRQGHEWAALYSRAYGVAGAVDPDTGFPILTIEDPRNCIGVRDPQKPGVLAAFFKVYRDTVNLQDVAVLYLPGQMWVATAPIPAYQALTSGLSVDPSQYAQVLQNRPYFNAASFTFVPDAPVEYDPPIVPVVEYLNERGVGEFERHIDLLKRINWRIFQELVVQAYQAFRQRALQQETSKSSGGEEAEDKDRLPAVDPETNLPVNYSDLFTPGPDAMWILPPGVTIWESGVIDITAALAAVRDDLKHLAAITRTPMRMFDSDAITQSAEGASKADEALTFKAENRQGRWGTEHARLMSYAFAILGDQARAQRSKIKVDWRPAERYSLAEKADAAVKASSAGIPWRTRGADIWQYTPAELDRQQIERVDDATFAIAHQEPTGIAGVLPGAPGAATDPVKVASSGPNNPDESDSQ